MSKTTTITEKFDKDGNLVERVTKIFENDARTFEPVVPYVPQTQPEIVPSAPNNHPLSPTWPMPRLPVIWCSNPPSVRHMATAIACQSEGYGVQ